MVKPSDLTIEQGTSKTKKRKRSRPKKEDSDQVNKKHQISPACDIDASSSSDMDTSSIKSQPTNMEEHLNTFHNLGGNTIAEHKKNFNIFTRALQEDPNFDADVFFKNLHPKYRQEEIFRVKLLQTFNRHSELLEVLKGGDRILCRISLKDKNFLNSLLDRFSGTDFVNELTPSISFVTRLNLVNKFNYLIKDESVGEKYYNAVYEKYGLSIASRLLLACSEDFIKKTLTEFSTELNDRELIYLHKRYPNLLLEYLKIHPNGDYTFKLSTYLAKHDINEFHRLTKLGRFKLGKRVFPQYFKMHKEQFVKYPDNFPIQWKKRAVFRLINVGDIGKIITKLLQTRLTWKLYTETVYLMYFPRPLRGSILFPAFKKAYGCEIWEKPNNVSKDLLKILSLDDRMKFDFLDQYPELLPFDTAIKTIKTKINLTADIYDRSDLIEKMLETCRVNNSTGAELLEVLTYVHKQHKNDNAEVRSSFLSYLVSYFPLEKLDAKFWNLIEEMMLLFEVNNEHLNCVVDLLAKFLVYKLSNGLEYEKLLLKFFKQQGRSYSSLSEKVGNFEKVCLLHLPKLIPQIHSDEKEQKQAKVAFLSAILDYTRRHSNDPICPFDYFDYWMVVLDQYYENQCLNVKMVVQLLKQKPMNDNQKEMYETFWLKIEEDGAKGFPIELYGWTLKNRPWVLVKYADGIIVYAGNGLAQNFFYESSKAYYLGLTNLLIESAMKIVADPTSEVKAINASIKFLSCLSTNVLSNIAIKFAPNSDCKINVHEETMKDKLSIQTEILSSFKNVPLPSAHINTLIPFCNADYFQYSLEPFCFIIYHTKESDIEGPIFELLSRGVSARKCMIRITGVVGTTQLKLRVLTQMAKTEKNMSVQKYIFKQIHSSFVQEKTETFWQLLRDNMHLVSKNDEETLNTLKFCRDVPKKFTNAYLQMIWDYFAKLDNGSEFELIQRFDVDNPAKDPFFEQVLRNSLFNPKNKSVNNTEIFTAKFLLLSLEDMDRRLNIVWILIKNYLLGSSEDLVKVRTVYNLIYHICEILQDSKSGELHRALIQKMKSRFEELGITNNILTFELMLKFTMFCMEWDKDSKILATFIITEFIATVKKLGVNIIHFFADFIIKCLYSRFPKDAPNMNMLQLIKIILEIDDSSEIGLLCVLMLPTKCSHNEKKFLDEVLIMLKSIQSQFVQVYLDKIMLDQIQ